MNKNKILSIAIPTYCRNSILLENLERMLPQLNRYGIAVYISDDSPNSDTETVVRSLKSHYPLLEYRRNSPSLGHDRNCKHTLFWPDTDYVWYLGDSLQIIDGSLERILGILSKDYAFIFVNSYAKGITKGLEEIKDIKSFLVNATWYLTLSGATIYSRKSINWCKEYIPDIIYENFQQLGYILAYMSKHADRAYWIEDKTIVINRKKQSYWGSTVLKVFGKDWVSLIEKFPSIFSEDQITSVFKSHSLMHKLYSPHKLLYYRAENGISLRSIRENSEYLRKSSYVSLFQFYAVCLIPRPLAFFIKKVSKTIVSKLR